jgi:transcriptional regulator with XRE-family HTH domain
MPRPRKADPKPEGEPRMVLELRKVIQGSGYTLNQLGKKSRVSQSQLSRFVRGERDLTFDAASRVADVLGVQFVLPALPVIDPGEMPRRGRKPKGAGGESPPPVPPAKRRRTGAKNRDK